MKLTPIRVRGKRGQPKAAKRSKRPNSTDRDALNANGQLALETKRAKTHHDGAAAAAVARADGNSRAKRKRAPPRLSQLPQEILERVFIASMNLALPLVNRELCHRLSSDSVRYQLVGAAFGPTWDAWYGLQNAEVQSYDGWMADADRVAGDPTFQSAILACSWAKLPMLLESFNVWIRQHANGRPYFAFPADDALEGLEAKDYFIFNDMSAKFYHDVGWFSPVVETQLLSNWSLSAADFETMAVDCRAFLGQHLEVNPGTLIPDDLLVGPFFFSDDESEQDDADADADGVGGGGGGGGAFELYEEKYERLFWLVRGGACLQEEQTWEVSREGFRAILELIKAVAQRREAPGSQGASLLEVSTKVLEVAAGLFVLFDVLGVFSVQWPKYILQTSLAEVIQLIPTLPPKSAAETLLGNIAAAFRHALRNAGTATIYELAGYRWRRPALRRVVAKMPSRTALTQVRQWIFYRIAWQHAVYLDTALKVGCIRQQQERGEISDSTTTTPPYASRSRLYRDRFEAYMAAVGADPRLVFNHHVVDEIPNLGAAEQGGLIDQTGEGAGTGAAPLGIIAHEPWSDFGLD